MLGSVGTEERICFGMYKHERCLCKKYSVEKKSLKLLWIVSQLCQELKTQKQELPYNTLSLLHYHIRIWLIILFTLSFLRYYFILWWFKYLSIPFLKITLNEHPVLISKDFKWYKNAFALISRSCSNLTFFFLHNLCLNPSLFLSLFIINQIAAFHFGLNFFNPYTFDHLIISQLIS